MDWLNELYERLARDGMECGAVCDLLREQNMRPKLMIDLLIESRTLGPKLVEQYHREGIGAMSAGEIRLLLGEKQLHLVEISERCNNGESVHLNVVLKRALEREVQQISQALKGMERGPERGR